MLTWRVRPAGGELDHSAIVDLTRNPYCQLYVSHSFICSNGRQGLLPTGHQRLGPAREGQLAVSTNALKPARTHLPDTLQPSGRRLTFHTQEHLCNVSPAARNTSRHTCNTFASCRVQPLKCQQQHHSAQRFYRIALYGARSVVMQVIY